MCDKIFHENYNDEVICPFCNEQINDYKPIELKCCENMSVEKKLIIKRYALIVH